VTIAGESAVGDAAPVRTRTRAMRVDAMRNRAKLLEVARKSFEAEGLSVPVDEIARRAGVGSGTIHRHFPTKESLFEAIVLGHVEQLADDARQSAESDDPGQAFVEFCVGMVERGAGNEDHHRPGEDGHAGYRVLDRISRGRLSDFGGGRRGRHDAVIKPKPLQAPVEGGFTVDDFTLDEEAGTVGRPAGNTRPIRRTRMASFGASCRGCPPRERCTKSKTGRKIVLHQQDDLLRKARRDDVWAFPQPSGVGQRVAARAS
jgi:AcrR family transcriptional regulator